MAFSTDVSFVVLAPGLDPGVLSFPAGFSGNLGDKRIKGSLFLLCLVLFFFIHRWPSLFPLFFPGALAVTKEWKCCQSHKRINARQPIDSLYSVEFIVSACCCQFRSETIYCLSVSLVWVGLVPPKRFASLDDVDQKREEEEDDDLFCLNETR